MSLSKLEDLPNEILYIIFDYLDGFHLMYSLNDLNSRLNCLINNINLSINTKYYRQNDFIYLFNCIFPFISNICSLTISNENTLGPIEMFVDRYFDIIPHNSIIYLKLLNIEFETWNQFVKNVLPKLSKLISLNIRSNSLNTYCNNSSNEIVNIELSRLKYLSLSIKEDSYYSSVTCFNEHMIYYQIQSIITYLSFEYSFQNLTRLFYLFEKINKIEYLQITLDIDDEIASAIDGPFILNSQLIRKNGQNLQTLIIQIKYYLLFLEIAALLKHFPQLEKFSLTTQDQTQDIQFYDGQKWEELIITSLPCLTSFRLYLFSKKFRSNLSLNNIIDHFRSSFWLNKKQWYIVCDQFLNGSIQLYTMPCPKTSFIYLNTISSTWDTTLPSLNLSTFDSITNLRIDITQMELNSISLPYFNNIKSIHILSLPNKNYQLSKHMNLSKIESVIDIR